MQKVQPAVTSVIYKPIDALGTSLIDLRDRPLLLIGFAGAFRRSELAQLLLTDITEIEDGLRVRLRQSKTDQEGEGFVKGIPYGFQQRLCELFGKDPEELGFMQEQGELTDRALLPVHNDKTPNILLLKQRQLRGWTQRDVAGKIGTYPVNTRRWERGEAHPGQDFQQKLCELFQCNYEE